MRKQFDESVHQMTYEQVAKRLNVSTATVFKAEQRAFAKMRANLKAMARERGISLDELLGEMTVSP